MELRIYGILVGYDDREKDDETRTFRYKLFVLVCSNG